MFQKAIEFREKYYTPPADLGHKKPEFCSEVLKLQLLNLEKEGFKLQAEIMIHQQELETLQNLVEDFMMLYYEKFFETIEQNQALNEVFSNPLVSNAAYHNIPKIDLNIDGDDSIFSLKNLGISKVNTKEKQLKILYRKLVKKLHPDSSDQAKITSNLVKFKSLQNIYKAMDFESMLAFSHELNKSGDENSEVAEFSDQKNIAEKIELLELKNKKQKEKLSSLISQNQSLQESPEYKLFCSYKQFDVRGVDFFEFLLSKLGNKIN